MSPAAAAYLEGLRDGTVEATERLARRRKSVKPTTIRWTKEAVEAATVAWVGGKADPAYRHIREKMKLTLNAATRVQFTPKPVKAKRSAKR